MLHLYDRATMARALTLDLDPRLHQLLTERLSALVAPGHDLTDHTEYLIVEAGDTEADIVRHVGFSPLVEPVDGARFGEPGFAPWWDYLAEQDGWFEMIITFGGDFAVVIFATNTQDGGNSLSKLCKHYAFKSGPLRP